MNQGYRIPTAGIPSLPDRKVLQALRNQVKLVRLGRPLTEGKLEYFRKALAMDKFHGVVVWVKRRLKCEMFSTLQEIEFMEQAVLNNDRAELIVQCCMILHFWEQERIAPGRIPDLGEDSSWIFETCGSLEEIAYLRSRLHFVRRENENHVLKAIYSSLMPAIERCFFEPSDRPKWQGFLLVIREAGSLCNHQLLPFLYEILLDGTNDIPSAAATLFLNYTADAIHFRTELMGNFVPQLEGEIISKLLELGASPMVSRHHHPVLFRKLENQLQTDRSPWWLELEDLRPQPYPTTLNMLLAHAWSPDLQEMLAQYTCCSLDAGPMFKRNYKVNRVPKLSCLAARELRETELDELPPIVKFVASKHQIIDLHWYDTWFSSP